MYNGILLHVLQLPVIQLHVIRLHVIRLHVVFHYNDDADIAETMTKKKGYFPHKRNRIARIHSAVSHNWNALQVLRITYSVLRDQVSRDSVTRYVAPIPQIILYAHVLKF